MNCTNHPDRESTAFCQACGRPLCNECTRKVGPAVYCEADLAARLGHNYAGGSAVPPPGAMPPYAPNPVLAAILGVIPGVGAMFNGQVVKGLIHIAIFATLCTLAQSGSPFFGILIPGWILYQAVDAYMTAAAKRNGQAVPDPFGLNDFSERLSKGQAWNRAGMPPQPEPYVPPVAAAGYATPVPPPAAVPEQPMDYGSQFPIGAALLIGLGVLFLVGDGLRHFFPGKLAFPLLSIGFGIFLFLRKMDFFRYEVADPAVHRWMMVRAARIAGIFVLIGLENLLAQLHIMRWSAIWPLWLIYFGLWALADRMVAPTPAYTPQTPPSVPQQPVQGTSIVPTHDTYNNNEEGR